MERSLTPHRVGLKALVGSGDRIMLFVAAFFILLLVIRSSSPTSFDLGPPSPHLYAASLLGLAAGIALWLWSVVLILRHVPRGALVTHGPYAWLKHPIYTSVALLVLPSLGLLVGSWMGPLMGLVLYVGSRLFAPGEEDELARTFGPAWEEYRKSVKLPWL